MRVAGLHAPSDAIAAWALTYDWRAGVYLIGHNQDRHTQVEVWGWWDGALVDELEAMVQAPVVRS